jgi:hypothetical protein
MGCENIECPWNLFKASGKKECQPANVLKSELGYLKSNDSVGHMAAMRGVNNKQFKLEHGQEVIRRVEVLNVGCRRGVDFTLKNSLQNYKKILSKV